jgi:hypothetical protein
MAAFPVGVASLHPVLIDSSGKGGEMRIRRLGFLPHIDTLSARIVPSTYLPAGGGSAPTVDVANADGDQVAPDPGTTQADASAMAVYFDPGQADPGAGGQDVDPSGNDGTSASDLSAIDSALSVIYFDGAPGPDSSDQGSSDPVSSDGGQLNPWTPAVGNPDDGSSQDAPNYDGSSEDPDLDPMAPGGPISVSLTQAIAIAPTSAFD